ncbi:SET domain-containing protein [Xylariaceae sp. FL0662B]|nr:SET domain-containing protein [Xylariaceae sp. FL0662B]
MINRKEMMPLVHRPNSGNSWSTALRIATIIHWQLTNANTFDPTICSADTLDSLASRWNRTCPLPIYEDAVHELGKWSPWTARPYCIEPLVKDVAAPPFCLYTFEPFRENQGLSVITAPDVAAGMIDALDDSIVPPKHRSHPSSPLANGEQDALAYEVKDLPGKGKGLVARRRISKFEVVMVDYPALITRLDLFHALGPELRQDVLERALHQLPERQLEEVLALARSTGSEPIEDTFRTNIFGIDLNNVPHLGIFTRASRINHECMPNVYWRYSVQSLTVEIVAMQDIEAGDEIVQSYVPLGLSYNDRKEDLKNWGFDCTCSLCASSEKQRALSDERRDRLQQIYYQLTEDLDLTSKGIGKLVKEMLSLVEKEQLEPQLLVYYGVVARAYMDINDLGAARKYVALCEELWIQYGGEDDDSLEGIQQLRRDLTKREIEEA